MESGRKLALEAAARGGAGMRRGWARRAVARVTLFAFLFGSAPLPVLASGTDTALGNATTTYGSGEFTGNTDQFTEYTQHTDHAILEWQTDIQQPADHSLEFRQAEDFVVLNRSPGERASDFWGRIVCDSTCIFANRAGVNFQDGSFVDVGQVIAAAGEISNTSFLADQYLSLIHI